MTKRLKILNPTEIKYYYDAPQFSLDEQQQYFALDTYEESIIKELGSLTSKVYFILLLGYFKANQQLFKLWEVNNIANNIEFIRAKYFPQNKQKIKLKISRPIRLNIEHKILKMFDYQICTIEIKQRLKILAAEVVTIDSSPLFVFKEIVHFLQKSRIILPGYTVLQELIGNTISNEDRRLITLVNEYINKDIQSQLNGLLKANHTLHEITYLKKEPKNFGSKQIKNEINKLKQITDIYNVSKEFLPKLRISNASIKYYASLVDYYTVYKLKRMNKNRVLVYLICFIHYRFKKINDRLVDCFIHHINNYIYTAKQAAKIHTYEQQTIQSNKFKKAAKILELFNQEKLDDYLFSEIRQIANQILPQEQFNALINYLRNQKFDLMKFEWDYYVKIAAAFKFNIRPLLLNLNFSSSIKDDKLLLSAQFLKQQLDNNGTLRKTKQNSFPIEIIPESIQPYLYDDESEKQDVEC